MLANRTLSLTLFTHSRRNHEEGNRSLFCNVAGLDLASDNFGLQIGIAQVRHYSDSPLLCHVTRRFNPVDLKDVSGMDRLLHLGSTAMKKINITAPGNRLARLLSMIKGSRRIGNCRSRRRTIQRRHEQQSCENSDHFRFHNLSFLIVYFR
jgi:hypothetical protein